eukprot:2254599-Pleurochrysis_carterae.AAC.1
MYIEIYINVELVLGQTWTTGKTNKVMYSQVRAETLAATPKMSLECHLESFQMILKCSQMRASACGDTKHFT